MSAPPAGEASLASLERLSNAGRTGEVYLWDETTVLKLSRGPEFEGAFEREARALEAAAAVPGLAPRLVGRITVDGHAGLLLERIAGVDLLSELERKPWRIWRVGRELAEVHARLNSLPPPAGSPALRETIRHALQSPGLPERERGAAQALLESLPDGDRLCHQDFHPGNLMRDFNGQLKVIDFGNTCAGDPDWDFAVTKSLIAMGELPPETPGWMRAIAGAARRVMLKSYGRRYRQLRDVNDANVERWTTVFLTQRLGENIPEERERLVRMLAGRKPRG